MRLEIGAELLDGDGDDVIRIVYVNIHVLVALRVRELGALADRDGQGIVVRVQVEYEGLALNPRAKVCVRRLDAIHARSPLLVQLTLQLIRGVHRNSSNGSSSKQIQMLRMCVAAPSSRATTWR